MHELTENLRQNFLGRLCTVLTQPVSLPALDHLQHAQFFSGVVVDINDYGVWVQHLHINTYAFFPFPIVGIVEEQWVPEDDPKAAEIREALKKKGAESKPPQPPPQPPPGSTFIPVESLTKMVRDTKRS